VAVMMVVIIAIECDCLQWLASMGVSAAHRSPAPASARKVECRALNLVRIPSDLRSFSILLARVRNCVDTWQMWRRLVGMEADMRQTTRAYMTHNPRMMMPFAFGNAEPVVADRRAYRHTFTHAMAAAAEREARAILAETEPHSGYRLDTEHVDADKVHFYREPKAFADALAESLAAFVAMEIS
jgi:hypothetical protein